MCLVWQPVVGFCFRSWGGGLVRGHVFSGLWLESKHIIESYFLWVKLLLVLETEWNLSKVAGVLLWAPGHPELDARCQNEPEFSVRFIGSHYFLALLAYGISLSLPEPKPPNPGKMTWTWSFQPRAGLGKLHPASVSPRGLGGRAEDAA